MLGDKHDSHSTWLGGILDGVGDIIREPLPYLQAAGAATAKPRWRAEY